MFYLSPQVDTKEVDLSTSIPAVATSIAVIALRDTYKGPELTQELITSENQLIAKFGKPRKKIYDSTGSSLNTANNYQDMLSAMGYLKYGNKLYCTRVLSPSATFAGIQYRTSPELYDVPLEGETPGIWSNISPAYMLQTKTFNGDIKEPDEFHDEADLSDNDLEIISMSRGA